jgi:hypothetical protein
MHCALPGEVYLANHGNVHLQSGRPAKWIAARCDFHGSHRQEMDRTLIRLGRIRMSGTAESGLGAIRLRDVPDIESIRRHFRNAAINKAMNAGSPVAVTIHGSRAAL